MPDWLVTMNELEARVRQSFQRRPGAGKNLHVFGAVQIIFFRDERSIAVEKYSAFHCRELWFDCGKNGIEFFYPRGQDGQS